MTIICGVALPVEILIRVGLVSVNVVPVDRSGVQRAQITRAVCVSSEK